MKFINKDRLMRILLLGLMFFSVSIFATPSYQIQYEYYDVYAWNQKHLIDDILVRSTIVIDGEKFMGSTDWQVDWRYSMAMVDEQCYIHDVVVDYRVVLTMPRLVGHLSAKWGLMGAFDRYYTALYAHEEQHMKHGFKAAKEIEIALWSIGAFTDCHALKLTANELAALIVDEHVLLDKKYDLLTNHGRYAPSEGG